MNARNYVINNEQEAEHLNYTARSLVAAALNRGWTVEYSEAIPDNSITGIAHCTKKNREIIFHSNDTNLSPIYGFFTAINKNLSAALFEKNGVPTPESVTVSVDADDSELSKYLKKYKSIVVKPIDANHGDGITIGVDNLAALKRAIKAAAAVSLQGKFVLLQRRLEDCKEYRFLVLENKVIAVAFRRPPFVVGDGKKTVKELIEEVNADPARGDGHKSTLTKINIEEVATLNDKNFLFQVPSPDEEVEVLKTSNLSRGGVSEDYTNRASAQLKLIATQAAKSCYLGLAGVDIMTKDIENGDDSNSFVIEVNSAPGLRMHEHPAIGTPREVSRQIWRSLEKNSRPISKLIKQVGRVEPVRLPDLYKDKIFSRIDTGATYSSIWAHAKETKKGLEVEFLGGKFSGIFPVYSQRAVQNSTGHVQDRYVIKMPVVIRGRKVLAQFSLADRSTQTYPILIGRNILRNKFIVDVTKGNANKKLEKAQRAKIEQRSKS